MAKVVTDNQYYTAIANAIRALTGSSNTYTPAQMAPAIIGYIAGGIDLSDVESYFITDVINAMNYVKELGTDDWVHHIIVTDTHWNMNYGHSTAIIKAMQDSGYFSKLIHLGDVVDGSSTELMQIAANEYGQFNGDMMFVVGNHDGYGDTGWQTFYYNAFMSDDTDIVVDSSSNYNYYWDDTEHNIRYIVYKYSATTDNTYAINRIKDAPAGYAVITMCHYKDRIESSIIVPLLGHQLDYIGNITGHYHVDLRESNYAGMYNEVSLNNDGWINDNPNYVKEDGTNNSQAITIMSINTSTRNVKFYRIGKATTLGQNWQYTYVKGGSVEAWMQGGYWGGGDLTANANGYYNTKLLPSTDSGGNTITYYLYLQNGTLSNTYLISMNSSGDYVRRLTPVPNALFNRIIVFSKSTQYMSTASSFLISLMSSNLASTDDIVLTTERPNLGISFNDVAWTTGQYISNNGSTVTSENSAVMSTYIDCLPSTTYRFYVDDANWSGTDFMRVFSATDKASSAGNHGAFATGSTYGSTTAGTKEITFTTGATTYYLRFSVKNIMEVTDWQTKIHLEVVA